MTSEELVRLSETFEQRLAKARVQAALAALAEYDDEVTRLFPSYRVTPCQRDLFDNEEIIAYWEYKLSDKEGTSYFIDYINPALLLAKSEGVVGVWRLLTEDATGANVSLFADTLEDLHSTYVAWLLTEQVS
jgi:hypothetical protein